MAKKKKSVGKKYLQGDIQEFNAAARARGLTYGQAQVEETCRYYQHIRTIPAHYRKVGRR